MVYAQNYMYAQLINETYGLHPGVDHDSFNLFSSMAMEREWSKGPAAEQDLIFLWLHPKKKVVYY